MSRLNKNDRAFYVHRIMDFKFEKARAELKKKEQQLFDETVDAFQGEHKPLIDKLPLAYFHTIDAFSVAVPGRGRGSCIMIEGAHQRAVSRDSGVSRWSALAPKDLPEEVRMKLSEFASAKVAHAQEEEALRVKLEGLLNGVQTTKRLYEAWPELEEIVPRPSEAVASHGKALTVSVSELNKLIPLPSKQPAKKEKKRGGKEA